MWILIGRKSHNLQIVTTILHNQIKSSQSNQISGFLTSSCKWTDYCLLKRILQPCVSWIGIEIRLTFHKRQQFLLVLDTDSKFFIRRNPLDFFHQSSQWHFSTSARFFTTEPIRLFLSSKSAPRVLEFPSNSFLATVWRKMTNFALLPTIMGSL